MTRPIPPAFDRANVQTRSMTADEARMAQALNCSKARRGPHRGTYNNLHARSTKPDRWITEHEAAFLRAHVVLYKSVLSAEIVELATGVTR